MILSRLYIVCRKSEKRESREEGVSSRGLTRMLFSSILLFYCWRHSRILWKMHSSQTSGVKWYFFCVQHVNDSNYIQSKIQAKYKLTYFYNLTKLHFPFLKAFSGKWKTFEFNNFFPRLCSLILSIRVSNKVSILQSIYNLENGKNN